MSDSKYEGIVNEVRTRLAAIVGDGGVTYWYTPDRVIRSAAWGAQCLESSVGSPATIYVLVPAPDSEEDGEEATGSIQSLIRLDLIPARRFTAGENPFSPPSPDRWTTQSRMVQDVKKKLREDVSLGGRALNVNIVTTERSSEDTFVDGWAVAFLRLVIPYTYRFEAP